jgi:hypothetical protein
VRPTLVSISGFSSEVGKTTLLCHLLGRLPGWEAIKITRGHYRSCGRDPHACCVSALLGEKPLVLSGRQNTFKPGKDTGRYWEAGAGNVHWVIGTSEQIEEGLKIALDRIVGQGALIEGTSFLKCLDVDYSIMVFNPSAREMKSSAVGVLPKVNALFIPLPEYNPAALRDLRDKLRRRGFSSDGPPAYFWSDLDSIVEHILGINRSRTLQPASD